MRTLVFATNNLHKLEEIRFMAGEKLNIIGMQEAGLCVDIPETGTTLKENAEIKADFLWNAIGKDCFSDDTGLEVDALGGLPGVFSARYAGDGHDFEANINKLLLNLRENHHRNARFKTVICLILHGEKFFFEGVVEGRIIEQRIGLGGFGYDSVFIPDGYDQTFAQLSAEEKNSISHRRNAFKKMLQAIEL